MDIAQAILLQKLFMFSPIEKLCFIIYLLHQFHCSQCKFVSEVCKLITRNKAYLTGKSAVDSTNKSNGASVSESNKYLISLWVVMKVSHDVQFFIIS